MTSATAGDREAATSPPAASALATTDASENRKVGQVRPARTRIFTGRSFHLRSWVKPQVSDRGLVLPSGGCVGCADVNVERPSPEHRVGVPLCGTYMGDPPPGLSVRGAFFGRKSDKEVCGGVVSVVSESSSRRWRARVPGRPRAGRRVLGVRLRACPTGHRAGLCP